MSTATAIRPAPVSADVEVKARTYLRDGRVRLELVVPSDVRALVSGSDPTPYWVRWLPRAGWGCTCPAVRRCAHIVAVALVTRRGEGVTP